MLTLERPADTYNDFDLALLPLTELEIPCGLDRPAEELTDCEPGFRLTALELWRYEQGLLSAREVKLFTLQLTEEQPIQFRGWAQADIDLYIMDPYGQMAACDNSDGGRPRCGLRPVIGGEYLVKLVNNADSAVEYRIYVSGE